MATTTSYPVKYEKGDQTRFAYSKADEVSLKFDGFKPVEKAAPAKAESKASKPKFDRSGSDEQRNDAPSL